MAKTHFQVLIENAITDFRVIKDLGYNKETLYITSVMSEDILETIEEPQRGIARNYYQRVKENINRIQKELIMDISDFGKATAETKKEGKGITINFDKSLSREKIKFLFLHELGEAEYIAHGFPTRDEMPLGCPNPKRMVEILSHTFLYNRLREIGLDSFIEVGAPIEMYSEEYKKDGLHAGDREGIITLLVWFFATHQHLRTRKDEIIDYKEYSSQVDAIIDILDNTTIYDSPDILYAALAQILNIIWSPNTQITVTDSGG